MTYPLKTYRFSSHARLIGMAKALPKPAIILEVGIGCGYLGRELSGNGFRIIGLEKDRVSAESAKNSYEDILVCDIDRNGVPSLGAFDAIVLFDILEHLSDPLSSLKQISGSLNEGGRVFICLPNIANWVIRLKLLFGNFNYSDKGLLDRTHLRFFTFRAAKELIRASGLKITGRSFTPLPFELFIRPKWLAGFLSETYFVLVRLCPGLFSYQFIFTAVKPAGSRCADE